MARPKAWRRKGRRSANARLLEFLHLVHNLRRITGMLATSILSRN